MRPPNIRLHIDELVLEGIDPADRAAVVGAFEQELFQLLANSVSPAAIVRAGSRDRIHSGVPLESDPVGMGRTAARALANSLAAQPTRAGAAQ